MDLEACCHRTLEAIRNVRVLVFGDHVLDAYWVMERDSGERSLETGLPVHRVARTLFSPGGAGNVAVALRRLGVPSVYAAGVVGDDPFGKELVRCLEGLGIETSLLIAEPGRAGACHAKPMRAGREGERFDFGMSPPLAPAVVERMVDVVRERLREVDVLVVNQQIEGRIANIEWLPELVEAARATGVPLWFDLRHWNDRSTGVSRKMNRAEARTFLERRGDEVPDDDRELTLRAARLAQAWTVVTRGEEGLLASDGRDLIEVAGIRLQPPLDPTGAGDTALAVLAAGTAARVPLRELLPVVNLTAAYTVTCVGETGCPDPRELLEFASRTERSR